MITPDNLTATKTTIDKLIAQGQSLYDDIAETAHDRVRLMKEADEREATIERLNGEVTELTARVNDLETRNGHLVDDTIRLESQLNDATARLDTIHVTSNTPLLSRTGNGAKDSEVGHLSTRLHKLAAQQPPRAHHD
jgi:chromosome segregation ATPase